MTDKTANTLAAAARMISEGAKELFGANLSAKGVGEPFGANKDPQSYAPQPAGKEKQGTSLPQNGGPLVDTDENGIAKASKAGPTASPPGTGPAAGSKAPMKSVKANVGPDGQHRASTEDDGVVKEDEDVAEGVTTDTTHPIKSIETKDSTGQKIPGTVQDVPDQIKAYVKAKGALLSKELAEDVKLIFNGQNLSEDFQKRAVMVLEVAVTRIATKVCEDIESDYATKLVETTDALKEQMATKLDEYLQFMTEKWLTENQVAIEASLRTEIAESFMSKLHDLMLEHYIDVPQDKVDVVEEMSAEIEGLKDKLNEAMEQAMVLTKQIRENTKDKVVSEALTGLTDVNKAKVKELIEAIEFKSPEQFAQSIKVITETYVPAKGTKVNPDALNEDDHQSKDADGPRKIVVEDTSKTGDTVTEEVNPRVAAALKALDRLQPFE